MVWRPQFTLCKAKIRRICGAKILVAARELTKQCKNAVFMNKSQNQNVFSILQPQNAPVRPYGPFIYFSKCITPTLSYT